MMSKLQTARFFNHLSVMLDAGLGLIPALDTLCESADPETKAFAEHLGTELSQGHTFSGCLRAWESPPLSPLVVATVKMGEESGGLVVCLRGISNELDRQVRARQRLLNGLTYPLVLLSVTAVMLFFMLDFMLPRFLPLLRNGAIEVPALTAMLLKLSNSGIAQLLALGVLLLAAIWRQPAGRAKLGSVLGTGALRVSSLRRLILLKSYSDVSLQLSLLLNRGVLVETALGSVAPTVWPPPVKENLLQVRTAIRGGAPLSEAFQELPGTPQLMAAMVRTGEEVGDLATFFRQLGHLLVDEYEYRVESFFELLEPVLMMLMGALVGVVVLATFLPIYALATRVF